MAAGSMGMAVAEDLDRYESTLRAQGFARIAGVDEVGRGALAGPLVAAAVVLPDDFDRTGIRDSKLLTAKQREVQCERIMNACVYTIRKIEPNVIDVRGLHRSNLALLRRCVRALDPVPDYVLTDGFPVAKMPCPALGVKKGDMVAASIAAASIVAKVTRDRIMRRLHRHYPAFDLAHNKGYGTPAHRDALQRFGPTPIHRLSFAGVGQPPLPGFV
jgi:ribonuclease HII